MFGLLTGRRRWILPIVVLFVIAYYTLPDAEYIPDRFRGRHQIKAHEFPNVEGSIRDKNGFLTTAVATPYCKAHNFDVFQPRTSRRKVYDLFMVNTELDWLEIRLNELKNHVDFFVILESKHTFTGNEKPLHVKDNWSRFSDFHDQIILRVLDDGALQSDRTWDHEDLQRNAMFDQVLSPHLEPTALTPALAKGQAPSPEDVILVSDIDEIPKPSALTLLRNCEFPARLTLRSAFYYYSFQWLHRGPEWPHPQATVYRGNDTIRPADLRNGEGNYGGRNKVTLQLDKADLWNSSWHCSTCFSTIEETVTKMNSFSHQGWNQPAFHEREHVVNRVRNGLDLFDRAGEYYDKIKDRNWDIPQFLVKETESTKKGWSWLNIGGGKKKLTGGEALDGGRFEYMLNRDPENGNFKDYSMVDALSELHEDSNTADRKPVVPGAEVAEHEVVSEGVKGGEGISPEKIDLLGAEEPTKNEGA